jgi:hypothetical protein
MADTNRVALAYQKETAFAEALGANVAWKALRTTGENAITNMEYVTSNELRSDRQIVDRIRQNISASGPINGELSYAAWDDFLEWALLSDATWPAMITVSVTASTNNVTVATAGGNSTITAASSVWISGGLSATTDVGRWISFDGGSSGLAANKRYWRIVSVSATVITVNGVMSAETLTTGTVTVKRGKYVTNGVTASSMALFRQYTDLGGEFEVFSGMMIDTMGLELNSSGIITCNFGMVGKRGVSTTTGGSTVYPTGSGTATLTPAPTNAVMNSVDHVPLILEAAASTACTQFSVNLNNNLRARQQIGTLGAISVGTGECDVSGRFLQYYATKAIMDEYLNATPSEVSLALQETGLGDNAYVLDFPQLKFTAGRRVAGGKNQDVIGEMEWMAYMDPTLGFTFQIASWT